VTCAKGAENVRAAAGQEDAKNAEALVGWRLDAPRTRNTELAGEAQGW
jgi:hypothetical protein